MANKADDLNFSSGLDRVILEILKEHVGKSNAIGRQALLKKLASMGWPTNDRSMRSCIKFLRRRGTLVLSSSEEGGYYLAASKQEFQDFDHNEFGAKISDMSETRQAMLRAASTRFGEAVQVPLL